MIEKNNIFKLLKATLHDKEPPQLEDVNWYDIYNTASCQCVLPLVYESVRKIPDYLHTDKPLHNNVEVRVIRREIITQNQLIEAERIARLTEEQNIKIIFLKGIVTCNYYSRPLMRGMGDIDILVDPNSYERTIALLEGNGYVKDEKPLDGQTSLKNKLGIYCEVHYRLLGEKFLDFNTINSIFDFNPEPFIIGKQHSYSLNVKDRFLHIITHAIKHYLTGTLDLRMLCDICIFVENEQDNLDIELIWVLLETCKFDKITASMLQICVNYLGMKIKSDNHLAVILKRYDELYSEYLLDNVMYLNSASTENGGTAMAANQLSFSANTGESGTAKEAFRHSIFPPYYKLRMDYKILRKYRFMYIFCAFHRIIKIFWNSVIGKKRVVISEAVKESKKKRDLLKYFDIAE